MQNEVHSLTKGWLSTGNKKRGKKNCVCVSNFSFKVNNFNSNGYTRMGIPANHEINGNNKQTQNGEDMILIYLQWDCQGRDFNLLLHYDFYSHDSFVFGPIRFC